MRENYGHEGSEKERNKGRKAERRRYDKPVHESIQFIDLENLMRRCQLGDRGSGRSVTPRSCKLN